MTKGDKLQIIYRNNKTHSFQILESNFIRQDGKYLYLEMGEYLISRIKSLRNLTKESQIDNDED